MKLNIEENKQEYIRRFKHYLGHRQGAQDLLDYITSPNVDFFTAPASVKDVLAVPGGSCKYTLMLHDVLDEMFSTGAFSYAKLFKDDYGKPMVTDEMIAAVALLSGLDNVKMFDVELKNRKSYDPQVILRMQQQGEGVKLDARGQYVWEQYEAYVYDDKAPLGTGVKALAFAEKIKLTLEERLALRWGHGGSGQDKGAMYSAKTSSILTIATQIAHETVYFLLANQNYISNYIGNYGVSKDLGTNKGNATSHNENVSNNNSFSQAYTVESIDLTNKIEKTVPFKPELNGFNNSKGIKTAVSMDVLDEFDARMGLSSTKNDTDSVKELNAQKGNNVVSNNSQMNDFANHNSVQNLNQQKDNVVPINTNSKLESNYEKSFEEFNKLMGV
jgi:hypothetical protein